MSTEAEKHVAEIDLNGDRTRVVLDGLTLEGVRAIQLGTDPENPDGPMLLTLTVAAHIITPTKRPEPMVLRPVTPVTSARPVSTSVDTPAPTERSATTPPAACEECGGSLVDENLMYLRYGRTKHNAWLCETCRNRRDNPAVGQGELGS